MTDFVDVTVPISENVPIYEGDPTVQIEMASDIAAGAGANVSKMCFGAHTGTHVDAPNHFLPGRRRVEDLDLDRLIGPCRVIEVSHNVDAITQAAIGEIVNGERLLFKTRNSDFWNTLQDGFREDFTYLSTEAAKWLGENAVKLVGIDYLSIEQFGSKDHATHISLLEKEIVILEGLDLRQISAGTYDLICLPLKYNGGGGDGAPARTLLRPHT